MKRFQLAIKAIQSMDLVETNRLYFFILSLISTPLIRANKYLLTIALLSSINIQAQQNNDAITDTAYQKVIAERAAKIVKTLGIADIAKTKKAEEQIAAQYFQLNAIHDNSKATVIAIKAKQLSKEETDAAVKKEEENKSLKLKQLHAQFIGQLKTTLTEDQVEKVKDGMTYRVLPVTWAAYLDMLQKLTPEQKDRMYSWLVEARELAMDEGSSEKKHAVFGKYKGKINNYLSAQGYNMKKEGEEWAQRMQVSKEAKQN